MDRPYRLFSGVAYPNVIPGDNPTREINADANNRHELYHDRAIRLSEGDLQRLGDLSGKPICFEHDSDIVVGEIQRAWVDDSKKLRINAKVFTDTECGKLAWQSLSDGKLAQLSVGYHSDTTRLGNGKSAVTGKTFNEVSLVRRGFFPGAQVSVAASHLSSSSTLVFDIMASNVPATPTSTPAPSQSQPAAAPSQPLAAPTSEDSRELLKQLDVTSREKSELLKKIEELSKPTPEQLEEKQLAAQYRAEKAAREREFQEQGLRKMQEVMAAQEQALGKPLSDAYKAGLTPVFASAGYSEPAGIVTELSFVARDEKAKAVALAAQVAELQTQLKAFQSNEARFTESVKATHNTILGLQASAAAPASTVAPTQAAPTQQLNTLASAFGSVYKVTAPSYSSDEIEMLKLDGLHVPHRAQAGPGIDVNASSGSITVTVPPLPVNASMSGIQAVTQNSLLRRWPQTAGPWAWAMNNATDQMSVRLHNTAYEEKRNTAEDAMLVFK